MSLLQIAFEGGILLMQVLITLLVLLTIGNMIAFVGEVLCGEMIRRDYQGEKSGNQVS